MIISKVRLRRSFTSLQARTLLKETPFQRENKKNENVQLVVR